MALIKLAGGVELDLATGDELRSGFKNLESVLGKEDPKPNYLTLAGSVQGSGAVATVVIGAPPAGRVWNIRSATCVGNNDHGTIPSPAGFFAMYFGDPYNPSLGSLAAVKLTLPSTTFFPAEALWCPSGQQVFFQTDLALNSPDQAVVVVSVAEWRTGELEMTTGR